MSISYCKLKLITARIASNVHSFSDDSIDESIILHPYIHFDNLGPFSITDLKEEVQKVGDLPIYMQLIKDLHCMLDTSSMRL